MFLGLSLVALGALGALSGCGGMASPAPTQSPLIYDPQHREAQVGREVIVRGEFDGPSVQADYIVTGGDAIYVEGELFQTTKRPAYGSEVEARGVLKFVHFSPSADELQHPPDYYAITGQTIRMLKPSTRPSKTMP